MRDLVPPDERLSLDDFVALVDQQQHSLHVFLRGMLGGDESAFDLVQETFTEAWQAAQQRKPPFRRGSAVAEMRRWLFRVGYHSAISWLRHHRHFRWESLDLPLAQAIPQDHVPFDDQIAEQDALARVMAQLHPSDVAVLLLRVVHGFSAAETGAILNTPPANIHNRLARAKQRLRVLYLDAEQPNEEQVRR